MQVSGSLEAAGEIFKVFGERDFGPTDGQNVDQRSAYTLHHYTAGTAYVLGMHPPRCKRFASSTSTAPAVTRSMWHGPCRH